MMVDDVRVVWLLIVDDTKTGSAGGEAVGTAAGAESEVDPVGTTVSCDDVAATEGVLDIILNMYHDT